MVTPLLGVDVFVRASILGVDRTVSAFGQASPYQAQNGFSLLGSRKQFIGSRIRGCIWALGAPIARGVESEGRGGSANSLGGGGRERNQKEED